MDRRLSPNRTKVIESYQNCGFDSIGLLSVAFNCLFPRFFDWHNSITKWETAKKVARKLGTNPLEILVLDTPTAMLPEKRKELIENPATLFGEKYEDFLNFTETVTKKKGKALRVNPDIFTPQLLADLSISDDFDNSYRKVVEEKAQSVLRDNLPHLTTEDGQHYDPKNPKNIFYETVATQTKDGILAAFKELVDNSLRGKDEQYKGKVALLAGLAALEVLFTDKNAKFASSSTFLNALMQKKN